MPVTVKRIIAYEITDSNGNPTIEAELLLSNGFRFTSSVSSDNVVNTYGLREMRDNDLQHYQGMGVKTAVSIINQAIGTRLVNVSPLNQLEIDDWLLKSDPTQDKSKLGVNTILVISQLFAKAGAYCMGIPTYRYINDVYKKLFKDDDLSIEKVPTPCFGILGGSEDGEFESFHIIPSSSLSFSQSYEIAVDIYHAMRSVLEQADVPYSKNTYGEMTPKRNGNTDIIDILFDGIQRKGMKLGKHLFLGLTVNGTNLFSHGKYFVKDRPTTLAPGEYYDYLSEMIGKYSVLYLEDAYANDDIDGWKKMYVNFADQIYLIGHKLIGANPEILRSFDHEDTITGMVIKPGYFGTITETLKEVHAIRQHELSYIVSSDRNDTDDDFLADFAMAIQADYIKFGAPSQGERVSKYNRLLKIEQQAKMQTAQQKPTQPGAAAPAAPVDVKQTTPQVPASNTNKT